MNKKWFWLLMVVLGAVIFVGGPLFVQYTHWPQGTTGHGDWLSFWGSYLGIIPSGLIAVFVASYQIKSAQSQIDKSRKEDLIIMRNTKIVDYLYEMKNSLAKSEVILNTDKPLSLDRDMYRYLQTSEHIIFEDLNWNELKRQNNSLYFLSRIIFDESKDKQFYNEMNNYTKNIKSINSFIVEYEYLNCKSESTGDRCAEHHNVEIDFELPVMVENINKLFVIVNQKINVLSA